MSEQPIVKQEKQFVVPADAAGMRLDRFLVKGQDHFVVPHTLIAKLVRKGKIRVDQQKCQISTRLSEGQVVTVAATLEPGEQPRPREMSLIPKKWLESFDDWVVFEDKDCLVINKPAGLAAQGGSKVSVHVDGILRALTDRFETPPKLVHRLDKETSGLLIFAKNDRTARHLTQQFKEKEIQKTYLAIITGVPKTFEGEIAFAMEKSRGERGELMQRVVSGGQYSHTVYHCLDHAAKRFAFMKLMPTTGRTHQLRVHMQALGAPILGDFKYGCRRDIFETESLPKQLYLHAWRIQFMLLSGKNITLEAPLPSHLKEAITFFQFTQPQ